MPRLLHLRDAEIEEHGHHGAGDLAREVDVVGLEVAVDHPALVDHRDGGDHRQHHVEGRRERHGAAREPRREGLALEEFHRQERHAALDADVEHRDDVRMLDLCDELGLADEARDGVLVRRHVRVEHLQRDTLVQRRAKCLVDGSKRPDAEGTADAVVPELEVRGKGLDRLLRTRLFFVFVHAMPSRGVPWHPRGDGVNDARGLDFSAAACGAARSGTP